MVLLKPLAAELVGTFILVTIHAGVTISAGITQLNFDGQAIAIGLTLMCIIYAFGGISGAHVNPNVTLTLAMSGVFKWVFVLPYIVAQSIGGWIGALFLWGIFGNIENLGSNKANHIALFPNAFGIEWFCTTTFLLFILRTSSRGNQIGTESALSVGFTLTFLTLFGGAFGVGSMNLIRTLSVATFSHLMHEAGIIISAQLLGVVTAVLLEYAIGITTPSEQQAQRDMAHGEA